MSNRYNRNHQSAGIQLGDERLEYLLGCQRELFSGFQTIGGRLFVMCILVHLMCDFFTLGSHNARCHICSYCGVNESV